MKFIAVVDISCFVFLSRVCGWGIGAFWADLDGEAAD